MNATLPTIDNALATWHHALHADPADLAHDTPLLATLAATLDLVTVRDAVIIWAIDPAPLTPTAPLKSSTLRDLPTAPPNPERLTRAHHTLSLALAHAPLNDSQAAHGYATLAYLTWTSSDPHQTTHLLHALCHALMHDPHNNLARLLLEIADHAIPPAWAAHH